MTSSTIRRHAAPLGLLGGCWLLVIFPLLGGEVLAGGDILLQERPFFHLLGQALSRGELPLWNPYLLCGVPHLAAMVGSPLHPFHLLLAPLGPELAVNLAAALHLLLAAVGAYGLAFHLFRDIPGGLVAAGIYALGGFAIMHLAAGHLSLLASFALVPAVLLALDRLLCAPGAARLLLAALALGLLALSGHPQVTLLGMVGAGLFVLVRLFIWRPLAPPPVGRGLLLMLAAATLGALLSAIQWLPALTYAARSGRAAVTDSAFFDMGALESSALALALSPGALDPRAVQVPWEVCGFVGIIGALLVAAAPLRRGRPAAVLLALLVLSLIPALGPAYAWLVQVLPGLGLFRVPGRFLALASLWSALLAALAMSKISARQTLAIIPGLLLLAALVSWGVDGVQARPFWISVLLPLAGAGVLAGLTLAGRLRHHRFRWALAALLLLELGIFAGPRLRTIPAPAGIHPDIARTILQDGQRQRLLILPPIPLNSAVQARVPGISGYFPAAPERIRHYFTLAAGQPEDLQMVRFIPRSFSSALSHLGMGFVLARAGTRAPTFLKTVLTRGDQTLLALGSSRPRAQLRRRFTRAASASEAARVATRPGVDLKQVAVLEGPLPAALPGEAYQGTDKIRWLDTSLRQLSLEVKLARPALLVLADSHDPGWVAQDALGRALPVVPVNGVLMGLSLGAGAHRIVLTYRPWEVAWGMGLSLLGLALLLCFGLLPWIRRKKLSRQSGVIDVNEVD